LIISEKKFSLGKKIKIRNLIPTSLIDWEGMIISTLYVGGCNFRCPYCYNADLVINPTQFSIIPEKNILSLLEERKDFIDGICLSGGEPTIYDDLPELLNKIKNLNLKVKLDTNGSNPDKLAHIIESGLTDFIAMDIKNCLQPEEYQKSIGINDGQIVTNIKKSIGIIINSEIDYEFRTTVIPIFHDAVTIEEIAREIRGARRYVLQNFVNSEKLLDNRLAIINPYPKYKMDELKIIAQPYVKKCLVR
jgi:pyruvate formate lyase activating enzyme